MIVGSQGVDRKALGALFLRRLAVEKGAESDRRALEVQAKRAGRAGTRQLQIPDFTCVDPPKRPATVADVERWWCEAFHAAGIHSKHQRWGGKERKLAKELLGLYGEEAVRRGLEDTIADWIENPRTIKGEVVQVPTLGLVWAMRAQVWGAEIAGRQPNAEKRLANCGKSVTMSEKARIREERRTIGEYHPKEKDPRKRKGSGW